jgi:hypothetical protein
LIVKWFASGDLVGRFAEMNVEFAPMAFTEVSGGSAVLLVKSGGWQGLKLNWH